MTHRIRKRGDYWHACRRKTAGRLMPPFHKDALRAKLLRNFRIVQSIAHEEQA